MFGSLKYTSFVFILFIVFDDPAQAGWINQSQDIMGTRVSLEIWHADDSLATQCSRNIFSEMHRIDALMSPYKKNSEISFINRQAAIKSVAVSSELYDLIEKSIKISRQSAGSFDITFASIGHAYDYRTKQQPTEQDIQRDLHTVNYQNLILKNKTISFAKTGMRIDLGGIAKGHAVDRAIDILKNCGIQHAIVSAGGDSRIVGNKRGRPWMMGIQHPRRKNDIALTIPLTDSAISTSGDYERFFISNDERIHHIINPKTGMSAKQSWSATVIGPDATSTDALSTTVFILGAEKGLKLINSLENMDAIIIDANGQVHYSSGLLDPEKSR